MPEQTLASNKCHIAYTELSVDTFFYYNALEILCESVFYVSK